MTNQGIRKGGRHCFKLCLLALACSSPALVTLGCNRPSIEAVILISLDTTRKDHLSAYGYGRQTSPRLDALAAGGALFENAVAQMTITNPSHASMFSGLYPHTHKVGENTRALPDEVVTLTEILKEAGFRTAGFVSGHPLRHQITGIDQGFDHYDSEFKRRRDGRLTTDAALAWLDSLEEGDRFFLFLHLYDAHGPYKPPGEYRNLYRSAEAGAKLDFIPSYQKVRDDEGQVFQHLNEYVDRYDAMLRYQDDLIAKLLAAVDLERSVVAVVADHGETFGERETSLNLNHGTSVHEEQVGIPFVFAGPGILPGRHRQPAETVDLLPTILDVLDLPTPGSLRIQGQSLADLLDGTGREKARELAFASNRSRPRMYRTRGYELEGGEFIYSVRSRRWKLIRYPGVDEPYVELYDLEADPSETENQADLQPEIVASLLAALDDWHVDEGEPAPEAEISPDDLEQLRALGYTGG